MNLGELFDELADEVGVFGLLLDGGSDAGDEGRDLLVLGLESVGEVVGEVGDGLSLEDGLLQFRVRDVGGGVDLVDDFNKIIRLRLLL